MLLDEIMMNWELLLCYLNLIAMLPNSHGILSMWFYEFVEVLKSPFVAVSMLIDFYKHLNSSHI